MTTERDILLRRASELERSADQISAEAQYADGDYRRELERAGQLRQEAEELRRQAATEEERAAAEERNRQLDREIWLSQCRTVYEMHARDRFFSGASKEYMRERYPDSFDVLWGMWLADDAYRARYDYMRDRMTRCYDKAALEAEKEALKG